MTETNFAFKSDVIDQNCIDNNWNNIRDTVQIRYAIEHLNETSDVREKCVNEILKWYNDNPKINGHRNIDVILYFLRGHKFDLVKTKAAIKRFYEIRTESVEWFCNRDPFLPEIQELLQIGVLLPLKKRDKHNRLIVIVRTAVHDPKKHSQHNVFKVGNMILDYALYADPSISLYGVAAIFDMKGVSLEHARQLPPALIKRTVESWENSPCQTTQLEFLNAPIYINVILKIFKSFMSPTLKSRVTVSKTKSIYDVELPVDLGGTGESYDELAKYWRQKVEENFSFYPEYDKCKSIID